MPLPKPGTLSRRDIIRLFLDEMGPIWCRDQTAHQITQACNVWRKVFHPSLVDIDSGEVRTVLDQRGMAYHKPGHGGGGVSLPAHALTALKERFLQGSQENGHMATTTNEHAVPAAAPVTQPAAAPVPENTFDSRIKQLNAETGAALELLRVCGGEPTRAKKVLDSVLSIAE